MGLNVINLLALAPSRWNLRPEGRVDNILYSVHGFDPQSNQFAYTVNSHFGRTLVGRQIEGQGLGFGIDVSIDLGTPVRVQMLRRSLDPGRDGNSGRRSTPNEIAARYSRSIRDVYKGILDESDSLLLSREQFDRLSSARATYRSKVDSVWLDLGEYMAGLPDTYVSQRVLQKVDEERERVWTITFGEATVITDILSPLQVSMIPKILGLILFQHQKWQSGG